MNKNKYPSALIKFIVILITFSIATFAFAAPTYKKSNAYISVGNLCEYIGVYQTDSEGSKNTCSFLPTISGSADIEITKKFFIVPQIGLTMPKSGTDENIKRVTFFTLANMKYKTHYVNFITGAGFYFTRISGPGGEAELNNGNSTDSFPLPDEAVYSRNFIVNLGLGFDFNKEWSTEVYTYIFNALKSEERALSVGLAISYHFGEII